MGDLTRVIILGPGPVVLTGTAPVTDARQIGQRDGAARGGVPARATASVPPPLAAEEAPETAALAEMTRKTRGVTRVTEGVPVPGPAASVATVAAQPERMRVGAVRPERPAIPEVAGVGAAPAVGLGVPVRGGTRVIPVGDPRGPSLPGAGPVPRPTREGPALLARPRGVPRAGRPAMVEVRAMVGRVPAAVVQAPETGPAIARKGAAPATGVPVAP